MIDMNKTRCKIELFNMDCMEAMKDMDDNQFDLAIVDPPYGIGNFVQSDKKHECKWNEEIPDKKYFIELSRVSKERIIWGANYYNSFCKGGGIVWNKDNPHPSMSKCEIASYSGQKKVDYYFKPHYGFVGKRRGFHPCEKPVDLYSWLLKNYAKEGDKILDTHLGSGSISIACYDVGFDLTGYEIDKDYYDAATKRLENHKKQGQLF